MSTINVYSSFVKTHISGNSVRFFCSFKIRGIFSPLRNIDSFIIPVNLPLTSLP